MKGQERIRKDRRGLERTGEGWKKQERIRKDRRGLEKRGED